MPELKKTVIGSNIIEVVARTFLNILSKQNFTRSNVLRRIGIVRNKIY